MIRFGRFILWLMFEYVPTSPKELWEDYKDKVSKAFKSIGF